MDEVTGLLEELARRGVRVAVEGDSLKINAPKQALTGDLRQRLVQNKEGLLRRLAGAEAENAVGSQDRIMPDPGADAVPFPLSDLQLGFYIANDPYMEFHVRPHAYMEHDHTNFDVARYRAAWNKALRRHRRELCFVNGDVELEMLGGEPSLECPENDLRDLPPQKVEERLLAVREEMARRELPLDTWPWLDLRVSLWRENGADKARVHYNHNSFFSDGFGTSQLMAEIDEYYENPAATRPPIELSYRDAVLGLERLAASPAGEKAREYWMSRLPDLPSPPDLPLETGKNRRCRSHLERRDGVLEKPLWDALKQHANRLGLTPSNVIIAAYARVIATWSNSNHFIFSQMMTRRIPDLHPDLGHMVGNFVSLYPLEIRLDSSLSFAANAERIQNQVWRDLQHLQFGGMRVLQELNRLQGSFGSAPSPYVVGSGLLMAGYKKATFSVLETSQTLLDHQFFELADGSYYYMWDLQEAFFPEGMVAAMFQAFHGLLRRLATDGDAWQQTHFDLVSADDLAERRERNRTARPVSDDRLHAALWRRAEEAGKTTALVSAQGSLTYAELAEWSDHLARELTARGVGAGHLVPVAMDRDQELVASVMAILRCGAAYVPIDPRLPPARIALLLEDVGSPLVLTQPHHAEAIAWPAEHTPLRVTRGGLEGPATPSPLLPMVDPALDLAYIIYTSGSTGKPKGVMIDHRGALNTTLDVNGRFGIGPEDRLFGISAFNFDLSVYDLFGAPAAGARLVYPDPASALDPNHWVDRLLEQEITVWNTVPALMSLLVETARRRGVLLPSLRRVLLSGDKIPLDLPAALREVAPAADIVSLGGATEASIWSILYPIGEVDPRWTTIPYGYPMVNQTWEVLDQNGRPCPTWTPGMLYIGGVGLAKGYWNDEEKTRQSFAPNPFTGQRLYRTGDQGRYLPGGCIEWMGRVDFQVKIQGHRIELGEIEAALHEHTGVARAVVTVQESPDSGVKRLVGHVVPAGEPPEPKGLESFLEGKLPIYMVPTAWRFLAELPLTANGKVDRKALSREWADETAAEAPRESVPPANDLERRLQEIWQEILNRPEIGVTDDFFDLGGQSFDAIRIFARIQEDLGKTYTLGSLWATRTIRGLARHIAEGGTDDSSSIVPLREEGTGTPLFLVHPAGGSAMAYLPLARLLERPLYGIQATPDEAAAGRRRDVAVLARGYVEDLQAVQAAGPYAIGGWSSGAMIAFEMVAQLEAAGETLEQVYLLDGPTPVDHGDLTDHQLLSWYLDDLALDLPLERLQNLEVEGFPLEDQLTAAAQALGSAEVSALGIPQLVSNFRVFRDLIRAGSRYTPQPIAADLTVVRVEQDIVDEFSTHPARHAEDWGWGEFTHGRVRCLRAPGTHHTFLNEALAREWVAALAS